MYLKASPKGNVSSLAFQNILSIITLELSSKKSLEVTPSLLVSFCLLPTRILFPVKLVINPCLNEITIKNIQFQCH